MGGLGEGGWCTGQGRGKGGGADELGWDLWPPQRVEFVAVHLCLLLRYFHSPCLTLIYLFIFPCGSGASGDVGVLGGGVAGGAGVQFSLYFYHFYLWLGRQVTLEYWGAGSRVELAGSFNGWQHHVPLRPDPSSEIPRAPTGPGKRLPALIAVLGLQHTVWDCDRSIQGGGAEAGGEAGSDMAGFCVPLVHCCVVAGAL